MKTWELPKDEQAYRAKRDMLNMMEDKGYDAEQAAEAIKPDYDLTIKELIDLVTI